MGIGRLADEDRALQDHVERALQRLLVEVLERESLTDTGVVDDHVQPAELPERAGDRRRHRATVGDVGAEREAPALERLDPRTGVERRLEVERRDIGADGGEGQGGRLADAPAGARDERYMAREPRGAARSGRHAREDTP